MHTLEHAWITNCHIRDGRTRRAGRGSRGGGVKIIYYYQWRLHYENIKTGLEGGGFNSLNAKCIYIHAFSHNHIIVCVMHVSVVFIIKNCFEYHVVHLHMQISACM